MFNPEEEEHPERAGPNPPLYSEREDSGIDSDDAYRIPLRQNGGSRDSSDASGSEEERHPAGAGAGPKLPWLQRRGRTNEQVFKAIAEQQNQQELNLQMQWDMKCECGESDTDRTSPPLYEVELTASDEDDDGSVLELVIPMQSARYQRVPTSSPLKAIPVAPAFFCNMFCCLRK